MSLSTSQQKQWEDIVDAISAMDGTDALPREYEATDYLPSHCHLSPELVDALRIADEDFNQRVPELFQPRTTERESYWPMPQAPTFVSAKNAVSRSVARRTEDGRELDYEDVDDRTEEGARARRRAARRMEGHTDAKDFHARYLAMTAATATAAGHPSGSSGNGGWRGGAGSHLSTSTASPTSGAPPTGRHLLGRTTHLTSGFLDPSSYADIHRSPDFLPIILIPSTVTSPLQLVNIQTFLTEGMYIDPPTLFVDAQTGATNVQDTKPDAVVVSPGGFADADNHRVAFRRFRVLDDPSKVGNWSHVCACLVSGKTWELKGWFPQEADPQATEPAKLFSRLCAFLPYFEEDTVPAAVQEWHVNPILLTRRATKTQQHIKEVFRFWELLYAFLDQHPNFAVYDVRLEE